MTISLIIIYKKKQALNNGFSQQVYCVTHINESCLVHLYTKNVRLKSLRVMECYFSDHTWVTSEFMCSD